MAKARFPGPPRWPTKLALASLLAGEAALAWLALALPTGTPLWPLALVQIALLAGVGAWVALQRGHHKLMTQRDAMLIKARQRQHSANPLHERLKEALDVLPYESSFALFDPKERLVLANGRYRSNHPRTAKYMVPGVGFESLLRHMVRHAEPAGETRDEAWVQQCLAAFRAPSGSHTESLPGNRWMRISHRRLTDGSTVVSRANITESMRKERALELAREQTQQAQAQLYEALEAMPVGLEVFDENDRLVYFNHKMGELRPWFTLEQSKGQTYEALLRIGLQHGFPPEAMDAPEAWLSQRLAERGQQHVPEPRIYPNGLWMHAYENRTPSGHLIAVRLDITELVQQRQALEEANRQLAQLSATDGLTGIANRRHFDEVLATEWMRGARQQEMLALLVIDIDHFKLYNDHYGHVAGDACLRRVAQLLGSCVRRAGEMVARFGGEEFVLLLPGSDREAARLVAQHCMDALENERIPHPVSPTADHVTLSIGIAFVVPDADRDPSILVNAADKALYRAKNAGRQQFEVSTM